MKEEDRKKILIVDDGSSQVKEAIEALNAIATTRAREGVPLPIVIEAREREEPRRRIKNYPIGALILGMMGGASSYGGDPTGGFWPEPKKPLKNCLQCGKEHRHNNSWCSPECCKEYKGREKALKKDKRILF
jgi:hypothetical protein